MPKSKKLDTSHLLKFKTKGVNIPQEWLDQVLEKEPEGSSEESRAREQPGNNQGTTREQPGNNQGTTREQPGNNQGTTREHSGRGASFFKFMSMSRKKDTKKILDYIRDNAHAEKGEWFCSIDTSSICDVTDKPASHIKTNIKRLEKQGWFTRLEASSGGYRLVKINPELYGLEKQ